MTGKTCQDILLDGLRRLEYRGYDSAGIAILDAGRPRACARALGKLANLEAGCATPRCRATSASATPAGPPTASPRSATPTPIARARSRSSTTASSRTTARSARELEAAGARSLSETDTELIAHLIDDAPRRGRRPRWPPCATPARRLVGSYALGRGLRRRPRAHGRREERRQPADPRARPEARPSSRATSPRSCPTRARCCSSRTGSSPCCRADGVQIIDVDGHLIEREPRPIQWDPVSAEKGGYDRFMQKEIFEQPRAITDTIGTRVLETTARHRPRRHRPLARARVEDIDRIFLVACGTAYYACLVGKYMIEQLAGIPVRGRSRQRVPLPQADRRPAAAW